jgi:hypothetical protein
MKKLIVILAVVIALIGLAKVTVSAINLDCQYPSRTTNPPGGCDNSDPCDPQDAAHGGSGACKVKEETKQANPSSAPPAVNDPQPRGEYISGK